jgi:hypothetical protein
MNHCKACTDWGRCWRDARCYGDAPAPTPDPAPEPVKPVARKRTVKKPANG